MTPRRIILLALLCGILGGVIAYTLTSYIARIYVEVSEPPARVYTRDVRISAAPYQTIEEKWIWIADITQLSDTVEYTITFTAENIDIYKICYSVGYYVGFERRIIHVECTATNSASVFTIRKEQLPANPLSVHIEYIAGRTRDTAGTIRATITARAIP